MDCLHMDVFYVTSSFYANYVFSGNKKITAPDVLSLPVKAHDGEKAASSFLRDKW